MITSDKRQYLYYLMDFTSKDDIWYTKIRDILYSSKDYDADLFCGGISPYCKKKPMKLDNFIRDRKINLIIN